MSFLSGSDLRCIVVFVFSCSIALYGRYLLGAALTFAGFVMVNLETPEESQIDVVSLSPARQLRLIASFVRDSGGHECDPGGATVACECGRCRRSGRADEGTMGTVLYI